MSNGDHADSAFKVLKLLNMLQVSLVQSLFLVKFSFTVKFMIQAISQLDSI